jgi:hypothetical protein
LNMVGLVHFWLLGADLHFGPAAKSTNSNGHVRFDCMFKAGVTRTFDSDVNCQAFFY